MGFIGWVFQESCTARNVVLQTVIPGRNHSLGAKERRRGHFRMAIDHIIGNRRANCVTRKNGGWGVPINDYVAFKFPSSTVWRVRARAKSFRLGSKDADWRFS